MNDKKPTYTLSIEKNYKGNTKESKLVCSDTDEVHKELKVFLDSLIINENDFISITILKQ